MSSTQNVISNANRIQKRKQTEISDNSERKCSKRKKNTHRNLILQNSSNLQDVSAVSNSDSSICLNNFINNLEDPGDWPELNNITINLLIKEGPKQIDNISFPVTSGRKFNPKHYTRILSNGDEIRRSWLVYSISKDAIFCFCCKLFTENNTNAISFSGYKNWTHIHRILKEHEQTIVHIQYFKKWKKMELKLSKNISIDSNLQKYNMSKEVQHWRDVLIRLLIFVEFIAVQSLAFSGSSDILHEQNNGNFLKLVETMAKFDPVLSELLRRINNIETQNKYLSPDIQKELIQIMSKAIKKKMIQMIKEAKYYSIIVNCTRDHSHKEHLSLIIRIVNRNEKKIEIKELFLGFLKVSSTTDTSLTDLVLETLKDFELLISDCRGQAYDNGSDMEGKKVGMQNHMKSLEPRAFFVPCATHSTNLILTDSVQCSARAVKFFHTVQSLYNFFSGSVSRWEILKKNVEILTLKPLCTTRWESRIDALKPLMFNLEDIYEALVELTGDDEDSITRYTAEVLGNEILQFDFICSILIWYSILHKINIFSEYFKNPAFCLTTAINFLQTTKEFLTDLRTEENFQNYICDAKEISFKLNVISSFPPASKLRSRRKDLPEIKDEVILSPENSYKVDFYFKILDQALQSVTEQLEQMSQHNNIFKFLHEISIISSHALDDLLKNCVTLEKHLSHNHQSDISGIDLFEELKIFPTLVTQKPPPSTILENLDFIFQRKLESLLPNLIIALKIILTIPITAVSGEDSFSKLKIVKKYLRSTETKDILLNLSTLSIGSEFAENLDYSDLVNYFAKIKARN